MDEDVSVGPLARERRRMVIVGRLIDVASACGGMTHTRGANRRDCFHRIKTVCGACAVREHPAPPSVHLASTRKPVPAWRRKGVPLRGQTLNMAPASSRAAERRHPTGP